MLVFHSIRGSLGLLKSPGNVPLNRGKTYNEGIGEEAIAFSFRLF